MLCVYFAAKASRPAVCPSVQTDHIFESVIISSYLPSKLCLILEQSSWLSLSGFSAVSARVTPPMQRWLLITGWQIAWRWMGGKQTSVGHLHPWVPGYKTPPKKGGLVKGKQQQLWQAIIIIKAASIKGVSHRMPATFLRRWWNLFRAAWHRAGTEAELHFAALW